MPAYRFAVKWLAYVRGLVAQSNGQMPVIAERNSERPDVVDVCVRYHHAVGALDRQLGRALERQVPLRALMPHVRHGHGLDTLYVVIDEAAVHELVRQLDACRRLWAQLAPDLLVDKSVAVVVDRAFAKTKSQMLEALSSA